MSAPFEAGEKVLLIDQRERTYLFSLQAGATYHTHAGTLAHDDLIGEPEGTRVTTARGMVLAAFRPRFSDYVLKMPREAQVVYPKDLGPIVVYADVSPGARVLEAGTGSGALSIALCRAVGEQGRVVSYELRAEHRDRARANIEGFFGKIPDTLEMRDGRRGRRGLERGSVRQGGPRSAGAVGAARSAPPRARARRGALRLPPDDDPGPAARPRPPGDGFLHIETFEVLKRGWHVTERSVRPDHRMVGHTGFLTVARVGPAD